MTLKLDNTYAIKTDSHQFILYKPVIRTYKESGEKYEDEENVGFYGHLTGAIKAYLKFSLRHSEKNGAKEIKELIESIDKKIDIAIKELGKYKVEDFKKDRK